jgi:hypothetical protein
MKKQYGHYIVEEETKPDGSWLGYRCSAIESTGKQGKLYIPEDGRDHYQAKKKDEDLEI